MSGINEYQNCWLVQDIDDRRKAGYGVGYTQKKPLNAAALENALKGARMTGVSMSKTKI